MRTAALHAVISHRCGGRVGRAAAKGLGAKAIFRWFARADGLPFYYAGIRRDWGGDRGTKAKPAAAAVVWVKKASLSRLDQMCRDFFEYDEDAGVPWSKHSIHEEVHQAQGSIPTPVQKDPRPAMQRARCTDGPH